MSKMFANTSNTQPSQGTGSKVSMSDMFSKATPSSTNQAPKQSMSSMFNVMSSKPKTASMSSMFNVSKPQVKKEATSPAELILIMGDVHIPSRIDIIPEDIKTILENNKGKFHRVICTGNFGTIDTYEWFKTLLPKGKEWNFNCVKNDFQETNLSFPDTLTVKSNEFKIGIINGYQIVPWGDLTSLSALSKQMECDILVSGFTHIRGVFHFEGKWFINPGTITGAFSPLSNNPPPSFMILLTLPEFATLYLYELNQSTKQFNVSKIDITK